MPRKKIQKNRDTTDKDRFFGLLNRAAKPLPKELEKDGKERSGDYSEKRVHPHTSVGNGVGNGDMTLLHL